ncbi:hypothetical protein Igag_1698 [Ignisphaera aggregans DSM 17230]|uniref:Peptidase A2 domain-containing protein n=1 Tax=Ignisphaera aggregans (strain DSM 17230 / JCM 13409 / AQ1.S1) TaxID=583356 RepID=E0SRW4_IGNAA|nr:hypothetical protein Igag_1698 [Ignisphaera aggregans DSM 17230]
MAHIYADIEVIGSRGRKTLEKILIDTGATFTVLPKEIIDEIGAIKIPVEPIEVELGDGRRIKAELYSIGIKFRSREGGTIAISFPGAKLVIGIRTLEDLGLKPNPITGEIEEERPPGVAYFYHIYRTMSRNLVSNIYENIVADM